MLSPKDSARPSIQTGVNTANFRKTQQPLSPQELNRAEPLISPKGKRKKGMDLTFGAGGRT